MCRNARWKADRVLTLEDARTSIRSQFPDLDASGLGHLGSGWEFDAFLTGDGWVFRFPRRAEYVISLERERAVHDLVAGPLAPVSVPTVELLGSPDARTPYPFAGHRFIPGVGADRRDLAPAPGFGRELGAALSAIHAIPVEDAVAVGVPPDDGSPAEWLDEARRAAPRLSGMAPDLDAALEWLVSVRDAPANEGPAVLIHNDIGPEHVLVDPSTGRLTGIIDWTDAALGDPALDFVGVVACLGWAFAEDLLRSYERPVDDAFRTRLSFLARVMSLHWLDDAHEREGDVDKHIAWVRNAFAGPEPSG